MDSLRSMPRPMDNGDPRVPMAWRHREMSFNSPYPKKQQQQQQSSPSVSSSSSVDDRDEVPMVRQHYRPHSRHSNMDRGDERIDHYATIRNERLDGFNSRNERREHPQFSSARSDRLDSFSLRGGPIHDNFHGHFRHNNGGGSTTGTLRSTRSVPALAFTTGSIDGSDPCPIHGGNHINPMRRHGSLFDMRAPPVGGPLSLAGLDKKVFHGSKHSLINGHPPQPPPMPPHYQQFHEPPQYMPPHMMMMRNPQHPLGVPMMLDPAAFKKGHRAVIPGYPTKNVDPYSMEQVCCKGHLIVLWIILGVVTVGVILGIIMGVTIT